MINYKEELYKLCAKMIHIPSVTGTEKSIVDFIHREMITLGFDDVNVDKVGNVIGKINCNVKTGSTVLFDGHLDTVAIPDRTGWRTEPFGAEVIEGKMYGRGTSDMKCSLAAMIIAAIKVKNSGVEHGDIYVSGTVFEEIAEGFSLRSVLKYTKPDFVVIGESTALKLNIGQRGRAEIRLKTKGIPAHSANPDRGVNAVNHMIKLIRELDKINIQIHPFMGKGEMVLTDIISGPYPGASVVPSSCTVTYDRRLLVGETEETVLLPIREVIEKLSKEDLKFEATCEIAPMEVETYTGFKSSHKRFAPGWLMDKDSLIVKESVKALNKAFNKDPIINCYSFCTNGSASCGENFIPTIGFGPSEEFLAHIDDEFIELESLNKALLGFEQLAISLSMVK